MRKVWKYRVSINDEPTHIITKVGFTPLCVRINPDRMGIDIWVLVDPNEAPKNIKFRVYGTGHPIENYANYIGTTFDSLLGLVWHVFVD